jgi:3-methyladenine DNA glycosylase/8-oxoguanine DNA glycosylase
VGDHDAPDDVALAAGRVGDDRAREALPGDLALRKAVQAAYQLDHLPTQQEVLTIAEKWRPYRSLATSYLFSAAFEPT